MSSMKPLFRLRLASWFCIVGAWAILVAGLFLMVLFYVLNNVGNGPNSGPNLAIVIFVELIIAILTFFFFLVLYAIGTLLNYVGTPKVDHQKDVPPSEMKHSLEENDTELEITPLQRE